MGGLLYICFFASLLMSSHCAEPFVRNDSNVYATVKMRIFRRATQVSKDADQDLGTIEIELSSLTPETSFNFAKLCESKYVGCPFHRVINNFMMQGGDFTRKNGTGGRTYKNIMLNGSNERKDVKLKDENFILKHEPYVISMANAGPNTGASQFFITFIKTEWLNGKHVVFGKVTGGKSVVDEVNKLSASNSHGNCFIKDCEITSKSKQFSEDENAFEKVLKEHEKTAESREEL